MSGTFGGLINTKFSSDNLTVLASGQLLTAEPTQIFDGKAIGADNAKIWQNVGTGTISFSTNKTSMSVTSGQYAIRQTTKMFPYFSGFPQIVEMTFDNLDIQADVVKRVGYYSSNAVAPHQSNLDGFWLEMDGTTYRLKASNDGSLTVNVPFASWDNYNLLSSYNFNNFTAIMFNFLWLGGAALQIFVCTPDRGWVLGHSARYVGNNTDTITKSPMQPLRYEIVSSTGTGDMRAICSQLSAAGQIAGSGYGLAIYNASGISCNTIGTVYALKGLKKTATHRDTPIRVIDFGCSNGSTGDTGLLMLLKNPTLSAGLTYANNSKISDGTATTQTVSSLGTIISMHEVGQSGGSMQLEENYEAWLGQTITDTFDEYVLAFQPTSTNQTVNGYIILKEYN